MCTGDDVCHIIVRRMEIEESNLGSGTSPRKGYFPIIKQYVAMGIVSVVLGNTVPTDYNEKPESFVYVSLLIILLLALWGSYLGYIQHIPPISFPPSPHPFF